MQVSEYQQYQDALAEDEFFDEDQVIVVQMLKPVMNICCFSDNSSTRERKGWMDLKRINSPVVSGDCIAFKTNIKNSKIFLNE